MQRSQIRFVFLNLGHFLDHFFMLIFASVAALRLSIEWQMSYAELIPYATPGLIAFGLCALPAGWIADKWNRHAMMTIFFIGIGLSSIITSFVNTPLEMAIGLTLIGVFAAIYHPVGLAMVIQGREKIGVALAANGIFGNMGVACAALFTGLLIDSLNWRSAFFIPGVICVFIGIFYFLFERTNTPSSLTDKPIARSSLQFCTSKNSAYRVFAVIFFSCALGGMIFQSTTFSLPKVFEERLADIAGSASQVGIYTFVVFSVAAFAQLIVGYLIDRYPVRFIFAAVSLLQCVLFASMMHLTGMAAFIVSIAFMLVVFGAIPITDVLVGRIAKSDWRSRIYAATYLISFSVSASAVPLIASIHANWGFNRLFGVLAVLAFLIFIAAIMLPKENKSRRSQIQINSKIKAV